MRRRELLAGLSSLVMARSSISGSAKPAGYSNDDTAAGWQKYKGNLVIGGKYGTVFDVCVLQEDEHFLLWGSWRPKKSLVLFESTDGINWSEPVIVLGPDSATGWEDNINRPTILKRHGVYHLWYTGQANGKSFIGYATSRNGRSFRRESTRPVLNPQQRWEKTSVMCPDVMWDAGRGQYRMWYSGGDQYEPDAIGYAVSADGRNWTRNSPNPIFTPDRGIAWENYKVTACQVVKQAGAFYMFYIGFRDIDHAQIGVARSSDGISGWQRHPANPIIRANPEVGMGMPATSLSLFSTEIAGCSGTTAAARQLSRLGWQFIRESRWVLGNELK